MSVDHDLVHGLAAAAIDATTSQDVAVATLFAAATHILLTEIGPEGAIRILEGLIQTTRDAFDPGETVQ